MHKCHCNMLQPAVEVAAIAKVYTRLVILLVDTRRVNVVRVKKETVRWTMVNMLFVNSVNYRLMVVLR